MIKTIIQLALLGLTAAHKDYIADDPDDYLISSREAQIEGANPNLGTTNYKTEVSQFPLSFKFSDEAEHN